MMRPLVSAFLAGTGLLAACGQPPSLEELAPDSTCRRTLLVGPPSLQADSAARERLAVQWILPDAVEQVQRLNAWCAAVGPAVVGGWAPASAPPAVVAAEPPASALDAEEGRTDAADGAEPPAEEAARAPPVVDSLVVVTWNVHVGSGEMRRFMADLRSGRLTGGGPVEHFVLLLQETWRGGPEVPTFDPGFPGGGPIRGEPPGAPREDLVELAEALELDLFYAPSMRNGPGEDRGNAIVSSLPLENLAAIPLPVERQRRVAVVAELPAVTSTGREWRAQLASVHLESDAGAFVNDAAARMRQARALLASLPDADLAIAGGDFNTRDDVRDRDLVQRMLRDYPETPPFPPGPTYRRAWGLYTLYLDYIFARLPEPARARYDRLEDPYNSDHHPLVGWIVLGGED